MAMARTWIRFSDCCISHLVGFARQAKPQLGRIKGSSPALISHLSGVFGLIGDGSHRIYINQGGLLCCFHYHYNRGNKSTTLGKIIRMKYHSDFKKLRFMAGLTQKELADELGLGHKTISRWETGERQPLLNPYQWKALCRALNVTADQIPDHFCPTDTSEGSK